MRDPRDMIDLRAGGSEPEDGADGSGLADAGQVGRPYLQLVFRCSGQYVRAYRNAAGTGYLARCPSCGKSVRFLVGAGGTSERFFEVRC
jgi:hypothetical protein